MAFVFQNYPGRDFSLPGLTLSTVEIEPGAARDLLIVLGETPRGVRVMFRYRSDYFRPETVRRMVDDLRVLIEAAVRDPDQPLSALVKGIGAEVPDADGCSYEHRVAEALWTALGKWIPARTRDLFYRARARRIESGHLREFQPLSERRSPTSRTFSTCSSPPGSCNGPRGRPPSSLRTSTWFSSASDLQQDEIAWIRENLRRPFHHIRLHVDDRRSGSFSSRRTGTTSAGSTSTASSFIRGSSRK